MCAARRMARTDHEAHGEAVGAVSSEDEDDVAAQQRVRNEHVSWCRDVEVGAASWAWRLVLFVPGRGTIAPNSSVFVWCQDLVAHGYLGLEPPQQGEARIDVLRRVPIAECAANGRFDRTKQGGR